MCLDPCHPGTYNPPPLHLQPNRNTTTTTGGFTSGGGGAIMGENNVVWCAKSAVTRRQRPGHLAYGHSKTGRGVCVCALCVARARQLGSPLRPVVSVHGCSGDSLSLRLLVLLQLLQGPHHGAPGSCWDLAHCLTTLGQWAVGPLVHAASLSRGSGQEISCFSLPHCLGAVGSGNPALPWGSGQWKSCRYTATLPGGSGQWISCCMLLHFLGAAGSGPPAAHRLTAWGQWAVEFLHFTAALPCGNGAVDLLLLAASVAGAAGSGCTAGHCLTACGQWAVGSGSPAAHYLTAYGHSAVGLLRCSVVWCGVV